MCYVSGRLVVPLLNKSGLSTRGCPQSAGIDVSSQRLRCSGQGSPSPLGSMMATVKLLLQLGSSGNSRAALLGGTGLLMAVQTADSSCN